MLLAATHLLHHLSSGEEAGSTHLQQHSVLQASAATSPADHHMHTPVPEPSASARREHKIVLRPVKSSLRACERARLASSPAHVRFHVQTSLFHGADTATADHVAAVQMATVVVFSLPLPWLRASLLTASELGQWILGGAQLPQKTQRTGRRRSRQQSTYDRHPSLCSEHHFSSSCSTDILLHQKSLPREVCC